MYDVEADEKQLKKWRVKGSTDIRRLCCLGILERGSRKLYIKGMKPTTSKARTPPPPLRRDEWHAIGKRVLALGAKKKKGLKNVNLFTDGALAYKNSARKNSWRVKQHFKADHSRPLRLTGHSRPVRLTLDVNGRNLLWYA